MRVFLGSTFEDLKAHRARVIDVLTGFEKWFVGAMELWPAGPDFPLHESLKEVAQSDVYVCVQAFRYGTLDAQSGKSITQLEYEHARSLGKPGLAFLMDGNYRGYPPHYVDKGESGQKLDDFKQILLNEHYANFFTTPEDLALMSFA